MKTLAELTTCLPGEIAEADLAAQAAAIVGQTKEIAVTTTGFSRKDVCTVTAARVDGAAIYATFQRPNGHTQELRVY